MIQMSLGKIRLTVLLLLASSMGCRSMLGDGLLASNLASIRKDTVDSSPASERTGKQSKNFFTSLFHRDESELSQQWNMWGSRALRDGDLIFTMGSSRVAMCLVNFSEFSTDIADSRFSHVGVIAIEDGTPVVYDIISGGPRRKELGWYLDRDKITRVAFKRPQEKFAQHAHSAVQFCRQVYADKIDFDERFRLDNDQYYCAEMVDTAYRRSGLTLCSPVPINQLPNFDQFSKPMMIVVQALTSIEPDQQIILPGNENIGIWSSPTLFVVLPEQSPASGPPISRTAALPVRDDARRW
jgi:hypothetical protein